MPCDTITVQQVGGLEKADPATVAAVLRAYGYGSFVTWEAGKGLTVRARDEATAASIRKAVVQGYSRAVVEAAAKRAGWKLAAWEVNRVKVTR